MHNVYALVGASNHAKAERETNDFYASDPEAIPRLLAVETFSPLVWECAVGAGHMAKPLTEAGHKVFATDIVDRGWEGTIISDFLKTPARDLPLDIITNPPYAHALEFVNTALRAVAPGQKVAMLLRILFLESVKRKKLFTENPCTVYIPSKRITCLKGGAGSFKGGAQAHAWFVWTKGRTGKSTLEWI